jgi:hypothetical protein
MATSSVRLRLEASTSRPLVRTACEGSCQATTRYLNVMPSHFGKIRFVLMQGRLSPAYSKCSTRSFIRQLPTELSLICSRWSLRFDASELHDFGPVFGFGRHVISARRGTSALMVGQDQT